jgi:O-antigen/teichoic acid export membrane protein
MRDVLQVGGALFALQACAAITSFSDSILISIVLGPESVADVAVPSRLFSVVSLGVAILLTPLWPAYTDALARGEIEWVKRTFRRSLMIVALLALPGAVVMLALHEAILAVWMGPGFVVNRQAVMALAIWCVIDASMTAIAMLLNAAQVFRVQLILGVSMMVASVVLRIVLLNWIGAAGAPIASILAFMLTTLIPMCMLLPRILRNLEAQFRPATPG